MLVLKVSVENFMSIGQMTIDYNHQGLVLVEGDNQDRDSFDSNGAGKSCAFVEALIWCLFDTTIRGTKKDGVVNRAVGKDCRVTVLLDVDGHLVGITRYRSHSQHGNSVRITVDGVDKSASTMKNTEAEIANIVKITPDLFYYTCVLGQGMTHRFSELTDAGRKGLLETIIKSDVYEKARQKAREKHQQMAGAEQFIRGKVDQAKTSLMQQEKAAAEEGASRAQQLAKVNNDIGDAEIKFRTIEKDMEALRVRKVDVDVQKKEQEAFCTKITKWLDEQVPEMLKKERELGAEQGNSRSFQQRIEAFNGLSAECPMCYQQIPQPHRLNAVTSLQQQKAAHDVLAATLDTEVKEMKAEIEKLNVESKSARQVFFELQSQLTTIDNKLIAMAGEGGLLRQNIGNLNKLKANLETASQQSADVLEKLKKDMAELEKDYETKRLETQKYAFWADAFPSIRARMLEKVLTFLNERLQHYLNVLSEGDLNLVLEIVNDKIIIKSSTKGGDYTSASGGEKRRMDIAMALALNDLAIASTGFSSNFLVTDEPADMLDLPGLQRLTGLLKDKAYRIGTVFVITQSPAMKSMIDKHWVVRKEAGVSSLETA